MVYLEGDKLSWSAVLRTRATFLAAVRKALRERARPSARPPL